MMRLAVFALSPLLALAACGGSSGGGRVAVAAKGDATTSSDATTTSTATTATDATTSTTTDAATTRPPDATTATTTATDAATTTNPDVTVSCGSVTLAGALTYYEESSPADDYVAYILGDGGDLGFGGDLPDLLWIEFYADVDQT
ncbi:MAG: hypothetical protein IT377_10705, partial [Polyangiaceae bacterium]|nr:hypothetical protein [Polyangiaceae bacterium]